MTGIGAQLSRDVPYFFAKQWSLFNIPRRILKGH